MRKKILAYAPYMLLAAVLAAGCGRSDEPPAMPNYLGSAVVGDWARYSVVQTGSGRAETARLRVSIVSKGAGEVKLEETQEAAHGHHGHNLSARRSVSATENLYNIILGAIKKDSTDVRLKTAKGPEKEKIKACGKVFNADRYTLEFTGIDPRGKGLEFTFIETWWLSSEAPLDGVVKLMRKTSIEAQGKTRKIVNVRTLIEFGSVPRIPNYLGASKKGDWAIYDFSQKTLIGEDHGRYRHEVLKAEGTKRTMKNSLVGTDKRVISRENTESNTYMNVKKQYVETVKDLRFVSFSKAEEKIKAPAGEFDTTRYTIVFTGTMGEHDMTAHIRITVTLWLSPNAPLDGVVKRRTAFTNIHDGGEEEIVRDEYILVKFKKASPGL